jgi:ubiquitin carboxyl-terminal hydrolase 34
VIHFHSTQNFLFLDGDSKASEDSGSKETKEAQGDDEKKDDTKQDEKSGEKSKQEEMETEDSEMWNSEEKDKLLQFIAKIFLMNFPPYMAYKHMVHSSLEVGQQEYSQLTCSEFV